MIGSVLVYDGEIVGCGHNCRVQNGSVILHGEMDVLENVGCKLADFYWHCMFYTMLLSCLMCSGVIVLYGISRVVIGENQTFLGEEQWLCEHGVELQVLNNVYCIGLMC